MRTVSWDGLLRPGRSARTEGLCYEPRRVGSTANAKTGAGSKLFTLNRGGLHWSQALFLLAVLLLPLAVLWGIGQEQYLLSAVFGVLFTAVMDPGGAFGNRASRLAVYALAGTALTALGFALGGGAWGWVVLAASATTFAATLAATFGAHRFVAADVLNIWFIIALAIADSYQRSHTTSHTWAQTLAWLAGSALWIAVTLIGRLVRRSKERPQFIAELPGDRSRRKLDRPLIMFAVIRALAIGITVAIAWGLDLPHADWMPIAAIVAMKPRLDEAKLASEQRLVGAFMGAVLAAVFLVTVKNVHALELITIGLLTLAGAIRFVNYALYCAAIAAGVLIALDIPNPGDFADEAERVLFTFIGLAVGLLVMVLAGLLAKRAAKPPTRTAAQPA